MDITKIVKVPSFYKPDYVCLYFIPKNKKNYET